MLKRTGITIAVAFFVVAGSTAQAGLEEHDLCKERKAKAAGKKAYDLLKAFGKNVRKPDDRKLGVDVSTARSKFAKVFARAEERWDCATTGDSGVIESKVRTLVEEVIATQAQPGSPGCTAADIIVSDPGCPSLGPCQITKAFEITGDCVLDFGTRDVTVSKTGELRIDTASLTLKAGNFTVAPGGLVDGTTTAIGGTFTVEAIGNIAVERDTRTGKILVSGKTRGGVIRLDAGAYLTIEGDLQAHNRNTAAAPGGRISLSAGGDILSTATSTIDVHGGLGAFGGRLDLQADGNVDLGNPIDNTGGDGGWIAITAGEGVVIRGRLNTTGKGDAGNGGEVEIFADAAVEINGQIQNRGTGSPTDFGGGDGGSVDIWTNSGSITVRSEINVQGGAPDGGGGDIAFRALGGSIDVQSTAALIAAGNGIESIGGAIELDAQSTDVTIDGPLDSSADGFLGGDIWIIAGRDVRLNASLDASARAPGGEGGFIAIDEAQDAAGSLTINVPVAARGGGCDAFDFCGFGGSVEMNACDITLALTGRIDAHAPGAQGDGGSTVLRARNQLTVLGPIDATGGWSTLGNRLVYPSTVPPVVAGEVTPAPSMEELPVCTGSDDPPLCLTPCPG